MTTDKEIELKLKHMDEKIDSTAKYILLLIGKIDERIQIEKENTEKQIQTEKENTEKLIAVERRNTNIFVGIIVIIVVLGGIKYLFHL